MSDVRDGAACYEIEAWDSAQVLCRVLALSAQQGAALAALTAQAEDDRLHAVLRFRGIDGRRAAMLAEKMRALVAIERVSFTFAAPGSEWSASRDHPGSAQDAQHIAAGHLADVLR